MKKVYVGSGVNAGTIKLKTLLTFRKNRDAWEWCEVIEINRANRFIVVSHPFPAATNIQPLNQNDFHSSTFWINAGLITVGTKLHAIIDGFCQEFTVTKINPDESINIAVTLDFGAEVWIDDTPGGQVDTRSPLERIMSDGSVRPAR